ncbi:MAG: A/G-specific adenine glycosylase [Phycisphaerales bacterium JB059]
MPADASPTPAPEDVAPAIEAWFRAERRDLPWRPHDPEARRDPYACLVSELMLQQTQVARVIDRYAAFMARFPDVRSLARADEADVLALWSGLGYYRRARLLHAAARAIVERHDATFPDDPRLIQALPGVGRYTAGSIASMAFLARTPIVDGNVARVLLRLHADDASQTDPETRRRLWTQAQELVDAAHHPGVLNEGLMELGATRCTPRAPDCAACPVRAHCAALAQGRQHEIPTPKTPPKQQSLFCDVIRVRDARGRLLIERRPDSGLWGGLYQAPTLEASNRHARRPRLCAWIGADALVRAERFTHQTTHRLVRFRVWEAAPVRGMGADRAWKSPRQIRALALSSPQRRILLPD